MSYTYPEALAALESIANEYIKVLRPRDSARVYLVCDAYAQTASVTWDCYGIRIKMPVRAATSKMTQAEFEDWVSYLLHEMGHPTHTDQTAWRGAVAQGLGRMVNALEDVRIEKAVIASGIVPNARAVLSRLISRKVAEARGKSWRPNSRKEFGWTICVLGRAANGYAINADDLAWIKSQIKSGSTVETVLTWALPELASCTSTADCVELAAKIMKALAAPQGAEGEEGEEGEDGRGKTSPEGPQGEGEGEKGEGEEGEKGEGEKGEGEGEGEEGEDGEGEEGEGEEGEGERDGENSDAEGEGAGKGGRGHGIGATDDEAPVTSENDLEKHELAPEGETLPRDAGGATEKTIIDILRDSVIKSAPRDSIARKLGANGVRLRDAAAQASKQRTLLARALRANEQDEREGGRRSGRLDRKALVRAMTGAPNVFLRRDVSEGFDTDVCVLLDASGSMAGANMDAALEAGLVISQAAGSVGAPCTVEIFNSTGYRRAGGLASKRQPSPADFGALVDSACGGTPLSAHMARAAVNQAQRAGHKRRVVFVITDGGCDYGPFTVKRMAQYLEQTYGTILAHVSIGTPLQGSFRAEVCVPWGTPLSQVGLDHFVKVLQAL